MTKSEIERRLVELESEVARLKEVEGKSAPGRAGWWQQIAGSFAGDPAHEDAMRLGRKYRMSLRPKTRRRRNGRA
jgi:hypothetical protein